MSWAVKLVLEICKVFSTAPEKFCFIQQLENMFSEITREFFEFSVTGEVLNLSTGLEQSGACVLSQSEIDNALESGF